MQLDASDWTRDTNVAGLVHDETRLTVRGLNNERLKWLMDACRDSVRGLDLSGNAGIDSWEPMHGAMPNLQWLCLDGTAISSWTGIEGLRAPNLQWLSLDGTAISSPDGFASLNAPRLEHVHLKGAPLRSIDGMTRPGLRIWWDGTVECAFIQAADPHPDPCCICLDTPGTHRYRTCTCTARMCAGCCEGLLEARHETNTHPKSRNDRDRR